MQDRNLKVLLVLAALVGACAPITASRAEEKGGKGRPGHGPCKADVEKFCKNVEQGKGRVARCLKEHKAELSQACRDGLAKKAPEFRGPMGPRGEGPKEEKTP